MYMYTIVSMRFIMLKTNTSLDPYKLNLIMLPTSGGGMLFAP